MPTDRVLPPGPRWSAADYASLDLSMLSDLDLVQMQHEARQLREVGLKDAALRELGRRRKARVPFVAVSP